MVTLTRQQLIYETHVRHPDLSYQELGKLLGGITRQRVGAAIRSQGGRVTIPGMKKRPENFIRISEPMSATQVAKLTGIPYRAISDWVHLGWVKVVSRPDRRGPGAFVLLDPQDLEYRVNRYQPKPRRAAAA